MNKVMIITEENVETKRMEGRTAVPFQRTERKPGQHPYMVTALDSSLWSIYTGAYGDVRDYLSIVLGERKEAPERLRLRRLEREPKTNYEIAFDDLCETLWHQMSFYLATWLVLPYLAQLLEGWEKEEDWEWCLQGIVAAGTCLATDVFGDRPTEESVYKSYENATMVIRAITIDFLALHMDVIQEKEIWKKREFAAAVMAILGERKLAYLFFLAGCQSCYVVCPECENCDEEIEFGYCEPDERIKAAKVPEKYWDGKNFEDVSLWLFNLFALLGDREGEEYLCYCFGTYTCPECGKKMQVLAGMKQYYLSE